MYAVDELSKRLYRQLDCTGYNKKMMNVRRKVRKEMSRIMSVDYYKQTKDMKSKVITGGSRGEGTSKCYESDTDLLSFLSYIKCVESSVDHSPAPPEIAMFSVLTAKPGYCMLQLISTWPTFVTLLSKSLVPHTNGIFLLSSSQYRAEMFNAKVILDRYVTMTGPALTRSYGDGFQYESICTFSCPCVDILQAWSSRPRPHGWPPVSLCEAALHIGGNLVATGMDNSDTDHLEWRYCFNELEMQIVGTLNDTQVKLYKVLKIINNDIFKQKGCTITSFFLKNIVFWLAESHPQTMFLPEKLYHWVLEALLMTRRFVEINSIPYYIIPDRNLLTEKVKESERPKLLQVITTVIESAPTMLLECATLQKHASLTPHDLQVFKQKLEALELCQLAMLYQRAQLKSQDKPQNELTLRLVNYQRKILSSGWPSQIQQDILKYDHFEAVRLMLG